MICLKMHSNIINMKNKYNRVNNQSFNNLIGDYVFLLDTYSQGMMAICLGPRVFFIYIYIFCNLVWDTYKHIEYENKYKLQ